MNHQIFERTLRFPLWEARLSERHLTPLPAHLCVCRRDSWAVEGFWDSVNPLIAWKTESGCGVFFIKKTTPRTFLLLTLEEEQRKILMAACGQVPP